MCLDSKYYFSPSKLISPFYRERVFHVCKCGKCAECKEQARREWYFRLYYEFKDCVEHGGYVVMDCLTYDDKHLPHLSDFIDDIDWSVYKELDFPCFSPRDYTLYMKRFRERVGKNARIRSFFVSEYGVDDRYTHRPHYHQLIFVNEPNIKPIQIFETVNKSWQKGRTQYNDERGKGFILKKYVITSVSLGAAYYVSKYVMKDSAFQATIDNRLNALSLVYGPQEQYYRSCELRDLKYFKKEWYWKFKSFINEDIQQEFLHSLSWKRKRLKLSRYVSQFYRPSLHFGASFLQVANIQEILESGLVSMPDSKLTRRVLSCPMYFKRKLFYDLVKCYKLNDELNFTVGKLKRQSGQKVLFRFWSYNKLGKIYSLYVRAREYMSYKNQFEAVKFEFKFDFDVNRLVHYVCHQRGRLNGDILADPDYCEKLSKPNLWITLFDDDSVRKYKGKFVACCRDFLVRSPEFLSQCLLKRDFINRFVYFDSDMEKLLDKVFSFRLRSNLDKQVVFDLSNEIKNDFKFRQLNYGVPISII